MEVIEEYELDLSEYECCKPMLQAMLCITPNDDTEEKMAILAAVNQNPNIESYLNDNFTSEIEAFYICER